MKKILSIIFILFSGVVFAQTYIPAQATIQNIDAPNISYMDPATTGSEVRKLKVANKDNLKLDTFNINNLNSFVMVRIALYAYSKNQSDARYLQLSNYTFAGLSGKPTTLSGYGITDAYPLSTNPANYISTESDPTVPAVAKSITSTNTSNWNTAFSWGNHAGLYPLLSGSYVNPSWLTSIPNTKITYTGSASDYIKGDGSSAPFPSIPPAQVQSDWNAVSGLGVVLNKPNIPTNTNQLINGSGFLTSETDPTIPAYSKTLSAFSVIKNSTDALYYPLSGNPSNFLTSFTETDPLFNTKFGSKTTTDLTEGTNLYWTSARFNTAFSGKTTDNLIEGSTNLYFSNARVRTAIYLTTTTGTGAATYNSGTGVLNIPTPAIPVDYTNLVSTSGGAGQAVYYLTSDKTSTGTALYTTIDYVGPQVNNADLNYAFGWSYNSTTKALTVTAKASVGITVSLVGLTLLGVPSPAANGVPVFVLVKGH